MCCRQERARALFARGNLRAYGALFEAAFSTAPHLRRAVRRALQSFTGANDLEAAPAGAPRLWVGVHMRHTNAHDDGSDVAEAASCINQVTSSMLRGGRPTRGGEGGGSGEQGGEQGGTRYSGCTVLLATDRPVTVTSLPPQLTECSVFHLDLDKVAGDTCAPSP